MSSAWTHFLAIFILCLSCFTHRRVNSLNKISKFGRFKKSFHWLLVTLEKHHFWSILEKFRHVILPTYYKKTKYYKFPLLYKYGVSQLSKFKVVAIICLNCEPGIEHTTRHTRVLNFKLNTVHTSQFSFTWKPLIKCGLLKGCYICLQGLHMVLTTKLCLCHILAAHANTVMQL